ncbi:hypothetical protein MANES_03G072000v8 [Manihot esculenta]|uniref:Uncharacterized protein n=1 Tax=Manihot esculenta TaxID=3983 RepID=A0A2C9W6V0_MANES|nr:hypothetical protein MANES_03G072000v8 [Manihot esculenta]
MATDVISPYLLTCFTFFFFFLLISNAHSSMANTDQSLPPAATTTNFTQNGMPFLATRPSLANENNNTVSESQQRGLRFSRSPLPWQEKIFNASAHEVPSGPNPISNR